MLVSTLTSKGQATIPVEIREALSLHGGDKIVFQIKDNAAVLMKIEPTDYAYYMGLSKSLSEWNSAADEAYNDL